MELQAAQKLALKLMSEHGLTEKGWKFKFDNGRARFGQCRYGTRQISMSRSLTELNDEPRVLNTILHEIAHALCGPGTGHGPQWKWMARTIGCDASRCYTEDNTVTPDKPWVGTCPNCGKEATRFKIGAKSRATLACSFCCKRLNGGRWSSDFVFRWTHNGRAV